MKLDNRYKLKALIANLIPTAEDEFMIGDIYDDYQALRREHPEDSFDFVFGIIDTKTGLIAEGTKDYYSYAEAALCDWYKLFAPGCESAQGVLTATNDGDKNTESTPQECPSSRPQAALGDSAELHLTCPMCGCDHWYSTKEDYGVYTCANCASVIDIQEMSTKRTGSIGENSGSQENCSDAATNTPTILSAQECWASQTNRNDFVTACNGVMRAVLKARDSGKRECVFNPSPADQTAAVKEAFLQKGYSFRPYGYSGGVWQDVEMICW